MNSDMYDPDQDPRFRPEPMAEDFADEIAEYIAGEAATPQEAVQLAESMLGLIRGHLQATDWQERISSRGAFLHTFGNNDDDD